MSIFSNLFGIKHIRIGGQSTNKLLGFSEYAAKQEDKNYPFDTGYATSSDVYAITNKIARTGKSVPWKLMIKKSDEVEEVTEGALYDLIQNPNTEQNLSAFVEESLLMLLLSGNLYTQPGRILGFSKVTEVHNLAPQLLEIKSKFESYLNKPDKYIYHIDGKEFKFGPEEITHTKYANPTKYGVDTLYGLSPLVAGFLTLTGLVNNQTAHASILENQGAAGILSNESDHALTPEARDQQQKLFDTKYAGARKLGKMIQSLVKVKYTKLGLDPSALKIIEGKALKMRDLCNIFDVSSVLFNDPQNRIQANLIPAETALWRNAILPNLNTVVGAFTDAVLNPINEAEFGNSSNKYYIELDLSEVSALSKDEQARAATGKTLAETITSVLVSALTTEQKVLTLMHSLDMSEAEARQITEDEQGS